MGKHAGHRKSGTIAALVTVLLGWVLTLPGPLVRISYDVLQLFLRPVSRQDLVIVHIDQKAMEHYGASLREPAGRYFHAGLLDRLSEDQPLVVVLDMTLTEPARDQEIDVRLANALHRNGRVVLAAERGKLQGQAISSGHSPPLSLFETNAKAWGTAKVWRDPDGVVRRYDPGDDIAPDLAWAAATVAGAPITRRSHRLSADQRWLNYYGSPRPFGSASMSYTDAGAQERGFFKDKAVFIGGRPDTLKRGEIADVFGTPFTAWNSDFIPGVDLTALAFSNLMHGEWLTRPGFFAELAMLLLMGVAAGAGLQRVQLRTAIRLSLGCAVLTLAVAIVLVIWSRVWFPWAIISLAQVPCALLFRLFSERGGLVPAGADADASEDRPTTLAASPRTIEPIRLEIPDHTLIRCIGEGSYGQVWVARNAIGLYHAVKVVYQNRFGTEGPYERALRGIQKFMPVSRSHGGFVHILHVGRNEAAGYFFYIMEAGDDEQTGQQIDPATYIPKTLASELRHWERLSGRQCLEYMIAIAEAAERLHQHQLIHRDIKPANIIFVNGRPKLADIDLVTDLSPQGEASHIGTEGYMAPEGPGTAAADVFSLGRVLYVTLTGKSPGQCPELPTRVSSLPDCDLVLELNGICCKACEIDPKRRYASAALMRADLVQVASRWKAGWPG
ncbi:MAG TPA: serine/threonine-protein kinase [Verrucomicrobiae bacterium]|nr:serine/threonine-protein kinase [Verrucomicrobiae bacterium]